MRRVLLGVLTPTVLALTLAGCAPATRFPVTTTKKEEPAPATERTRRSRSLPADLAWMPPDLKAIDPHVTPIEFVDEATNPAEWAKLKAFWALDQAPRPQQAAALFGLPPLAQGAVAAATVPVVKIKVPAGLAAVGREQLPAANPPTVARWQLGKQLFFDDRWLQAEDDFPRFSCASCHKPALGFAEPRDTPGLPGWHFNTPTLVNVVYNKYLFWDGRASALEEVVQRTLEDERESVGENEEPRPHVWGGVVSRLRALDEYDRRFREVFGTPPTQDALGKALATYMRTILSGDSLHDRAEKVRRERKGKELEPADYEKVLVDDDAVRAVLLEKPEEELPKKEEVARQLHAGWALFHGKAKCSACHGGANFTDNGFHNLGVELLMEDDYAPGKEPGRFAVLPIGLKDRAMIGAYKTPTLRSLPVTGPYFHNGLRNDLFEVVRFHVQGTKINNRHLDPLLRDPANPLHHRDFGLKEEEVRALAMFLKALEGPRLDRAVADPAHWPEGTSAPKRK